MLKLKKNVDVMIQSKNSDYEGWNGAGGWRRVAGFDQRMLYMYMEISHGIPLTCAINVLLQKFKYKK
jgi:hypothetical protein